MRIIGVLTADVLWWWREESLAKSAQACRKTECKCVTLQLMHAAAKLSGIETFAGRCSWDADDGVNFPDSVVPRSDGVCTSRIRA